MEILARLPVAKVVFAMGDLALPKTAEAVMAVATRQLGRIKLLVNSTGGNDILRQLHRTGLNEFPGILYRCLLPQLLCSSAVLTYTR